MGIWKNGDQSSWGPFVQGNQTLGDHLSMGTKFDLDHLSGGFNFMVIACPGGQEVGGPEVRGSNGFRTKCVAAHNFYANS